MVKYEFTGDNVQYTEDEIISDYTYSSTKVNCQIRDNEEVYQFQPVKHQMQFKTLRKVPKTGLMLVGWGGNNGSTMTAVWLANKHKISWKTKSGIKNPNYYGSIVRSSTVCLGTLRGEKTDRKVFVPIFEILPFLDPNDLEIDGWDISEVNLAEAMERAKVIDVDLQNKLSPLMVGMKPRKSVFDPEYLSTTQMWRANNKIPGTLKEQLDVIRADIRDFKAKKSLDKVIVVWTASTERYMNTNEITHNDVEMFMTAVNHNQRHLVSPSMLFAVASILEGCVFINGSPQNTLVKAIVDLAAQHKVFLGGNDFKTGQTKVKSSLVEFLIGSGLKPVSIASYNHLGNNDGYNLKSPKQFQSKQITQSLIIDDLVSSNQILYKEGETPDHCVVIQYIPYVGDSKKAMDEYVSEICMGGTNTIMIYNTCEDSLLAVPVMLDIILMSELFTRITVHCESHEPMSMTFHSFQTILSALGFMMKNPLTAGKEPVINGLSAQRACIENLIRACVGIPPQTHMHLEYKFGLSSCKKMP